MKSRTIRYLGLVLVMALVAACGDGGGDTTTTAEPTAEPTTTEAAPDTTEPAADTTVPAFEALYEGDLVLGYLMPQSGALSAIAPSLQEAANMAIADAEAAGNTAITTSIKNDGTDPVIAGGAADELLNENVSAIIGPAATGVSLSVIDRITGAGIPMCSPSNTGAIFTTYEDNGFYFRTAPPDNLQGTVHGDLITDDGATSVAIAHRNDEYGLGLATAILLTVFIQYELSFDKHFVNSERIFRLNSIWTEKGEPLILPINLRSAYTDIPSQTPGVEIS